MNELLFFIHIIIVVAFTFGAMRAGKEALTSLIALYSVLANIFVLKQTMLFTWNVTCSDVFAVGGILGLNLLQEYWGKEAARKAVWISLYAMVGFGILSQIHLFYVPSPFDFSHNHFNALFSFAPRLLAASLTTFFVVQQLDVAFYALLKQRWQTVAWQWRNSFSMFFTQFLDTVLFSFLGLYGIVASLTDIIVLSFLVKVIVIASIAVLTTLSKRLVRREI